VLLVTFICLSAAFLGEVRYRRRQAQAAATAAASPPARRPAGAPAH